MSRKPPGHLHKIKADIKIRVIPRSSQNEIVGIADGVFKVKLTAPPVEGKANKALQQFLARRLGVSKSDIEIVSGERARIKSIRIYGHSLEEVNEILKV